MDIQVLPAPGESSVGLAELRIEDDDGDRLFVAVTPTGSWQTIGGTLDTFTEDFAADGGGDGTFDLNSLTYTVVIAFSGAIADDWGSGEILLLP